MPTKIPKSEETKASQAIKMEEPQGAQYALQIAVHTLRERCKNLQQRVCILESENLDLRVQCARYEEKEHTSLNEVDQLREEVMQLAEQKEQLHNKVKMVTNENQDLWSKLTKLTRVNQSLGNQLSKINDTLVQHTTSNNTGLIRSKTFTKTEHEKILQKNLEENDKISFELEDISLKLMDSFSKQKKELDLLCSEIEEVQFSGKILTETENCAFLLDEELENNLVQEFIEAQEDLKLLKEAVLSQRIVIDENLKTIASLKDDLEKTSSKPKTEVFDKCTSTMELPKSKNCDKSTETENKVNQSQPISPESTLSKKEQNLTQSLKYSEKICPLCSKIFGSDMDFAVFQSHVEEHFIAETFEML